MPPPHECSSPARASVADAANIRARVPPTAWRAGAVFAAGLLLACGIAAAQTLEPSPPDSAELAALRHDLSTVQALMPTLPSRGPALYFMAYAKNRLGDQAGALTDLRDCLLLEEGFDPTGSESFRALTSAAQLLPAIESNHARFPAVSNAHLAFTTQSNDFEPEGLAYDSRAHRFLLGSLRRRTIVAISRRGEQRPFSRSEGKEFLPILGIRPDPADGSVWAASWDEATNVSELLHFNAHGAPIGRYAPEDAQAHGFNDLAISKTGIVLTDSLANRLYRFASSKGFSALITHRALLYPNGVAVTSSGDEAFVADELGVIRISLSSGQSRDLVPGPHITLSGIDGLYWRKGRLIAVQNGIGSARIVSFELSKDRTRAIRATVLENRTELLQSPTTGAVAGNRFYFIANSQGETANSPAAHSVVTPGVKIGVLPLP